MSGGLTANDNRKLKDDCGYISAVYVTKINYREQKNTNFKIPVVLIAYQWQILKKTKRVLILTSKTAFLAQIYLTF